MSHNEPFYCAKDDVENYLKGLEIDHALRSDELTDIIFRCSCEIERETRRKFRKIRGTERYDGNGQQKLVLRNYPIITIHSIKIYNLNYQLVREIKSTDTDFTEKLIIEDEIGCITLASSPYPVSYPTTGPGYWDDISKILVRASDYDYYNRFGKGTANIIVDYTYGYTKPPAAIRDVCIKMAAIELLKKIGAADSQGTSTVSIAGMSESFTQQGGEGGGSGPHAQLIGQLKQEVKNTLKSYRKKTMGVI